MYDHKGLFSPPQSQGRANHDSSLWARNWNKPFDGSRQGKIRHRGNHIKARASGSAGCKRLPEKPRCPVLFHSSPFLVWYHYPVSVELWLPYLYTAEVRMVFCSAYWCGKLVVMICNWLEQEWFQPQERGGGALTDPCVLEVFQEWKWVFSLYREH